MSDEVEFNAEELLAKIAKLEEALQAANANEELLQEQVRQKDAELEKNLQHNYRVAKVAEHFVPDGVDIEAEAKFAIGELTVEGTKVTGEISYRPPASPEPRVIANAPVSDPVRASTQAKADPGVTAPPSPLGNKYGSF